MRKITIFLLAVFLLNCSSKKEFNVPKYYELVNKAELQICRTNYTEAIESYRQAFNHIDKPFGKDVFNSALASAIIKNDKTLISNLQKIINNSDELGRIESVFVEKYLSKENWDEMVAQRELEYNSELRQEFKEILERDQLFRPMYDTHDDTINANRKLNVNRILEITKDLGFPAHQELGYTRNLRGQKHDIVLHHTAQRRSYDKSVIDLEPILKEAVNNGRFDPERAIFYLNFQNDTQKGYFEVYSSWQYVHPLLPDSLNNKVWLPKLSDSQIKEANSIRKKWYANTLDDIGAKAAFLAKSNLPFIFTCVSKSQGNLRDDFDKETALSQYQSFTSHMKEYKVK